MKQSTLIAFYGKKNKKLAIFLNQLLAFLMELLPKQYFLPYPVDQIHGTIIGLETVEVNGVHYNRNLWINDQKKSIMEISPLPGVVAALVIGNTASDRW